MLWVKHYGDLLALLICVPERLKYLSTYLQWKKHQGDLLTLFPMLERQGTLVALEEA